MKAYRVVLTAGREITPNFFIDLTVGQHPTLIGNQEKKDFILLGSELDLLAITEYLTPVWIDLKTRKGYHRLPGQLIFFYLWMALQEKQDLLKDLCVPFLKFQDDYSSDGITS